MNNTMRAVMFDEFQRIYSIFEKYGLESPLLETLRLYDILSKRALSSVEKKLTSEADLDLDGLAAGRKKGMPTEYLIGKAPFMGRLLYCTPAALIPREETELLAKTSIDLLNNRWPEKKEVTVINMRTGCGNIAVSIALNVKNAVVLASDLYEDHIAIAKKNVEQFDLHHRVTLFSGDLFHPIEDIGYDNSVEMIVCNPPYIPTGSLKNLVLEIKDNEPETAFNGGAFGIDIFRRLIKDAPKFLIKNGILIFEIGAGQEKLVMRLLRKREQYSDIEYFDDGEQVRVIKTVYTGEE
jgi:release factor glutamine methyltransferase